MTNKFTQKFFRTSANELKALGLRIVVSFVVAVMISHRTMQQHPDSMISGGLRWLSEGPLAFQYNTYGPFSYFLYGVFSVIYFLFGAVFGLWDSVAEFEIAYRTNSLNLGNLKYSAFYLALNLLLLIQSFYLLINCCKNSDFRRKGFLFLFFLTPIVIFQFTMETIEPLVFFGVSLVIYTFSNIQRLVRNPRLMLFLITLSWLFTFGIRISTLPIVFLYSIASVIKLRAHKERARLHRALIIAFSISLISYSPVFLDKMNLEYVISLNKSLSTSILKPSIIVENSGIFSISFGYWTLLILLAITLSMIFRQQRDVFEYTKLSLILLYISIYLVNQNGHPKYLIPLVPLLCLLLVQWELPKFARYRFFNSPNFRRICVYAIYLVGILQAVQTLDSLASKTSFDSRLEVKEFLVKFPDWQNRVLVTEHVLAEITRGPEPHDYDNLKSKVLLDDRKQSCADILILSSTSYSKKNAQERILKCSKVEQTNYFITISPFSKNHIPQDKRLWSALLSLGTSEDAHRLGYGPIYWIGVYANQATFSSDVELCFKIEGCKFSRF